MTARKILVRLGPLLVALSGFALEVPYLSGRVNDLAGLLDEATRQKLEERLKSLEQATGAQVVVLTIPSLDGESLEEYSHRVASTWKLGQKGKDNGVLFLIAKADRKMRLEVGYGLEGVLPDATCRRILDNLVRPRFRAGDFAGGIEAGVDAVAKAISGQAVAAEPPAAKGPGPLEKVLGLCLGFLVFTVVVGLFSLQALGSSGCQSWILYFFLIPFWTAFPMAFHPFLGIATGLGWILLFPVGKWLLHRTPKGKKLLSHSWLFSGGPSGRSSRGGFWSGGFGGFSGGSFSGGGFSGGGGSFGGGGASSSW
ncbi:MAG: TPM domain-containing protein [Thermoanaerobaculum sp.]